MITNSLLCAVRNPFLTVMAVLLLTGAASAELPLELIQCFHSDSSGSLLWLGCMSPGDLDGDGYSELFVAENAGARRVLVFSGGNPPDTIPDMEIPDRIIYHAWVPDLNGDGYDDFVKHGPNDDNIDQVHIWFGGPDFLTKTSPDLILRNWESDIDDFGNRLSAGDLNGDGYNDLVVTAPNAELPFDGRFCVYYGGNPMDTVMDDHINVYGTHQFYNDLFRGIGVGDINGDGLLDIAYSGIRGNNPGYVAIILGGAPLDSVPDYMIWSPGWQPGDSYEFGMVIEALGDINKDGYDDFAVGGPSVWPHIFFGGDPFDTIPVILGDTADDNTMGDAIANVGDLNDDGWDDIGVGFTSFDLGSGVVYIYYGYRDLDTEADLTFYHWDVWPIAGHHFGEYVGPAGDFNGDGVDDLVISSEQYFSGGPDDGNVYVYAGDDSLPTPADEVEDDKLLPSGFNILEQNYPNPFNNSTTIRYNLAGHKEREVEMTVYNLLGQRVTVLKQSLESGGSHRAAWDGKDSSGEDVPSGVYFYVLRADGETQCRKMLLLK